MMMNRTQQDRIAKTGHFIVFEGGEGAGKTTQIERSRLWLQEQLSPEIPIIVTREPGGSPLGQALRHILLEGESIPDLTELLLYAADRAHHVAEVLQPALAQGAIILCDRFTDSTIAYQGYGRGLDLTLIEQLNRIASQGLQSSLTLWLDVEVERGLARTHQRGKRDRLDQADLAFHQRVQQGFRTLAAQFPQRIVPIDANGSEEQVATKIQQILTNCFS
ncbi:dTMP kinase [Spirulina subsalsa]|uniref:dTMP kinase n=1 Tax=Spirulina subsalsa TaxID=54311 RepID=UPI00030F5620